MPGDPTTAADAGCQSCPIAQGLGRVETLNITDLSDDCGGDDPTYTRYCFEKLDSLFLLWCEFQVFFQRFNVPIQMVDDRQVILDHPFGRKAQLISC